MKVASLRTRLTWLIIAVQVGVLIPLGVLSYQRELSEMDQLLDGRLAQAGRTLGALIEHVSSMSEHASSAVLPDDALHGIMVRVHARNFEPEVGFSGLRRGRPSAGRHSQSFHAPAATGK